ncbi:MAG: PDZ domain-containing protein [Actinomycetota bacterium]
MGGAPDEDADDPAEDREDGTEFRPPLPREDRLWRHPSEMAAEQRAATPAEPMVHVSTVRTPWRQAAGLAAVGAIGGAMVVAGLFLTLGSSPATVAAPAAGSDFSTLVAFDPVVPVPRSVPVDEWAQVVTGPVEDAVVEIHRDGAHVGAGVLIRSDGVILTSRTVVDGADEVAVRMHDGAIHAGAVLGQDKISGLAAVSIDHPDTPTAPLGIFVKRPQVGDFAVAVPAIIDAVPGDMAPRTIAATSMNVPIADDLHLHGLIQLDGPAAEFTAGGPMVNDAGVVIGIVVDVGSEHATHAVPIAYARQIAEDFINYGTAKHSWLGIKGVDLDRDMATDLAVDGGVRVTSIIEGSPAHGAGLRKGDVITGFDGKTVLSMSELILELRRNPPGHEVEVRYLRAERPRMLTLTVTTRHVGDTT